MLTAVHGAAMRPPARRPARRLWPCAALAAGLMLGACDQESTEPTPDETPPDEVACPSAAPTAAFVYPEDGAPHTEAFLEIAGTASGARAVQVVVDEGEPLIAAGGSTWRTTVQLTPGPHTLTLTPLAPGDCPAGPSVTHRVVQGDRVTLMEPPPGNTVELRLDRLALEQLLPPAAQEQITLTELDLRPLVLNALAALEHPEDWGFDLDGVAAENLAGLLVMSPDTADLDGTGLAAVMDLSGQLGLAPARILSDMLALPPSERFLDPVLVADVMIDNLIASHPSFPANSGGRMPVTLADGLGDLAPLFDRYGAHPSGHPGFLAEPPAGELFTPAFAMIVRGSGNVGVRPGMKPGEGFASHVDLPPAGTAILDLDFEDPATFEIVGLHPEPRAALTLEVSELPEAYATLAGLPPDPWTLERIVGEASRRAFEPLWDGPQAWSYDLGSIEGAANVAWDAGWVVVDVVADLGPPPAPAWIWDMILDVAQARLHDGGLAEGEANVRLELPLLPIGLDAAGLIDTMRPILQAQRETLVGLMVGDPSVLPSEATIWLAEGPALEVDETAPALYPTAEALAEGSGGVRTVSLGAESRRYWTASAAGEPVVLDIGPWQRDRVVIGQTVMSDEE